MNFTQKPCWTLLDWESHYQRGWSFCKLINPPEFWGGNLDPPGRGQMQSQDALQVKYWQLTDQVSHLFPDLGTPLPQLPEPRKTFLPKANFIMCSQHLARSQWHWTVPQSLDSGVKQPAMSVFSGPLRRQEWVFRTLIPPHLRLKVPHLIITCALVDLAECHQSKPLPTNRWFLAFKA